MNVKRDEDVGLAYLILYREDYIQDIVQNIVQICAGRYFITVPRHGQQTRFMTASCTDADDRSPKPRGRLC